MARLIFILWGGGIVGLLAALGREQCEGMSRGNEPPAAVQALAAGWRMRHWLPTAHPLAPTITAQLVRRGPLAGITDEIHLVGRPGALAEGLRRAGWRVVRADAEAERETEPRVDIFSPDGDLRWSGHFRGADFGADGALMLDTMVLVKVARGDPVAPYVPVGCVTTLARGDAVAVAENRKF